MNFPCELRVQLMRPEGTSGDLESVLIAVDLRVAGRYYYGALVGLTDASGAAAITDRQLEVGFVADQQLFPMDYRVPLSGCDSSIVVRVEGGAEFREVQSDVATNPLIRANARRMWQAARNEWFSSTSVEVELEPRLSVLNVPVVVTPAVG